MEQLFTNLSHAVEGAPLIALTASFFWGILSIILSPCHLASIPLIVGFISEQGKVTTRRAFWTSTLFAVGILITIAAIGAITGAVLVLTGRSIVDIPTALVALAAMLLIWKVKKLPEPVIVAAAAIIGFAAFPGLHG